MRIVRKLLCSLSKRKNTLLGNGYTVEKSYGCKWLIDWSNSVDKKMAFKLFEDDHQDRQHGRRDQDGKQQA